MKQAEQSNEINFSDEVTSRNNEETSFVQVSEVEGFLNTSNEINSETTQRGTLAYAELNRELQRNNLGTIVYDNAMGQLCTNSEIESGLNRNLNTVCQQKFDVHSILSSVLNYCNYIIEGTPIPINSWQTDELRKLLESLKGLAEEISQKDYLEYVNDWVENHKSEISIVGEDAPPIDKNLNRTNYDLEMRNKQNGETEIESSEVSPTYPNYGQSKQTFLMTKDLQSLTNNITRMEQNPSQQLLFDNSRTPVSPNHVFSINDRSSEMEIRLNEIILSRGKNDPPNDIPNIFSDSPVNDIPSLPDSCFTSKEETSEPKNCKESQPNESVKRPSVDLNIVTKKLSRRKLDSNADMLIYKEKKVHVCHVCDRSFKFKHHFKYHIATHSDGRPFTCEVCLKKFKNNICLKNHKKIHAGIRFPCQFCKKSFSRQATLKEHILNHSDKTRHSCKICGKSFTTSSSLNNHNLIHTSEKRFDCPFCNKKFSLEYNLNRHLITHKSK